MSFKIYFVHHRKSSLAGYLRRNPAVNAVVLSGGKKNDMVHFLSGHCHTKCQVVIFDLARTNDQGVQAPCVSLGENILDNNVINYKYETVQVEGIVPPKVVFFANNPPDMSLLSMDRWQVVELPSYPDKQKTIEKMKTFNINF